MNSRIVVLLAAAILSTSLGGLLSDAAADETPTIEVVVTADRILTELVSTAAHVSVITAEQIRRSGSTNLVELLDRQPGISFRSFSNEAQATVDMRGFGEGSGNRVLILVDGRVLNNPDLSGVNWLGIPIDSIERVEVVRGGASALYGNHAVGGVINVITRQPEAPLEVTAAAALGSFLENQERAGLTWRGDRTRLRASAEHFFTEGHRDRSEYRALNFSLGAGGDLSDTVTLELGGRYGRLTYQLPGGLTKDEYKDDPGQARRTATFPETGRVDNEGDEAEETLFGIDADLKWRPDAPARLEVALGYAGKLVENDTESFGTYTNRNLHTLSAAPAFILDWDLGVVPMRSRLGMDLSRAQQEITGYASEERKDKTNEATLGQWTLGAVLSSTAYLNEQIDLGVALRYDRSEISARKNESDIDDDLTHQAVVFTLDGVYRPTEFSKVYASGGTLFRYPALDEQAAVQGFGDRFEDDLDPERGFNLELGGGVYLGRLLQADLSVYWMEMEDEIAYVFDPTTFEGGNRNIGETRRLGGDLQLSSEPIEQLRLSAGYSFVQAVFAAGDNKGNDVPLVPNHGVDGEAGIRPVSALDVEFGPAVTFRSESYEGGDDANDQDRVDSYFLTDIFVRFRPTWTPGELSLSAEIRNAFDVTYAPLVYYGAYYPAPGRTFRLAASYRY